MFDSIRQSCPNAKLMLVFCCVGNNEGDGYGLADIIASLRAQGVVLNAKVADMVVAEKVSENYLSLIFSLKIYEN